MLLCLTGNGSRMQLTMNKGSFCIYKENTLMIKVNGYGIGKVIDNDVRLSKNSYIFEPWNYSWSGMQHYLNDHYIECPEISLNQIVHISNSNILCLTHNKPQIVEDVECSSKFHSAKFTSLTGKKINFTNYYLFLNKYDVYVNSSDSEKYALEYELRQLAEESGFNSIDDAVGHVLPCMPKFFCLIIEYLNIFSDKKYMSMCRPIDIIY